MGDEAKSTKTHDALEECEEKLEELAEENAQLRKSAQAFGDLAERLNARTGTLRRLPRATSPKR